MDVTAVTGVAVHHSRADAIDTSRRGLPASTRKPKDSAFLNTLSIIAHDLRGPLANLAILVELMEAYAKVQAFERVASSARKAQGTIDALSAMLNGFLERTRETGDPLAFKPGLVDLAEVTRQVMALNAPVAESRDITLESPCIAPPLVQGDRRLLVEALDNLVGNAIRHIPQGSVVTLGVTPRGRDAVLAVSDNGPGLSDKDVTRALRPSASLANRNGQSFGLGLWITRLIAERHGGRVDVTARQPGGGARFELCLPSRLI